MNFASNIRMDELGVPGAHMHPLFLGERVNSSLMVVLIVKMYIDFCINL